MIQNKKLSTASTYNVKFDIKNNEQHIILLGKDSDFMVSVGVEDITKKIMKHLPSGENVNIYYCHGEFPKNDASGDYIKFPPLASSRPLEITAIADAGGGDIVVTAEEHGLQVGDKIEIYNTSDSNYNDYFTVKTVPTVDTFTVTATFGATDTGLINKFLTIAELIHKCAIILMQLS